MPTSSKRLHARAAAYAHAAEGLHLDWTGDALEYEEGQRLAEKLYSEYHRLTTLAEKREEKEQEREQRK
jgi:hypothetical protein